MAPKKASSAPGPVEPPPPPPPPPDPKIKLREQIQAQEAEIMDVRRLIEVLVNGEGHSVRDAKILELFKKNREVKVGIEREKNSNSKLKFQVSQLQQEVVKRKKMMEGRTSLAALEKAPEQPAEEQANAPQDAPGEQSPEQALSKPEGDQQAATEAPAREPEPEPEAEPQLKQEPEKQREPDPQWQEKFEQVTVKLDEAQHVRNCLSMEVAKLRQALQREVGEHVPIAKVLEEGGEWKGRSQQISLLKDKVKELKSKLQRSEYEEFERFQIQAFHAARRKEFEKLAVEFLTLREDLLCQKRKLQAMLARKKLLEDEIKAAKEKMVLLVRKSENDDRLIAALRLEVESYRQVTGPVQHGEKVGGPLQLELLHKEHKLADAFSELKQQCYQQELEIQAQAELISYLRALAAAPFEKEASAT